MHFPVALRYVDPAVRYPPGWEYSGEYGDVQQSKTTIQQTWGAMEKLVDAGLARHLGVSNFQGSLLMDLLRHARVRPATLQIEHHPYLVQEPLLKLAKDEGITVTAYSSLGPTSFIEMGWESATNAAPLLENETIKKIAEKMKKTPAQVLLRWATQRGIAVIPKSNNQARLEANLHVTDFDLSTEDLNAITALNQNLRFNNPTDTTGKLHIFA